MSEPKPPAEELGTRGAPVWQVTEEEAEQLRRLADAKPGEPGVLSHEPKAIPPGDASLIR